MKYKEVIEGIFVKRPNRFIAHVIIDGKETIVHVKNTGRCKEILIPGTKVILERGTNPERKTPYSLIAGYKENMLINIDSQIPNAAAFEAIREGMIPQIGKVDTLKREVTFGNSRFDLYFEAGERKGFIEVKGATLEVDGEARFPDAPTTRGAKHVNELVEAKRQGYEAYILFVIQMKPITTFTPNDSTDKAFGDALRNASKNGVEVLAYDCIVKEDEMALDREVKVEL